MVSEKLEAIDEKRYFIFRFNNLVNYIDVIDLNKSKYEFSEGGFTLEKFKY